jgi:hypothetical protein
MWVERIEFESPVLAEARSLSERAADACFSAAEVARGLEMELGGVLLALTTLEDADAIVREGGNWKAPATADTRWIVRSHATLTLGRRYEVLEICAGSYRVLDDRDEPILFHQSSFKVVDDSEPPFWRSATDGQGARYCGPPKWIQPGFFEDYHEGVQSVRDEFWKDLHDFHPETWHERQAAS